MFKYISEILSQFSITQRILALLIVLSSIVIITVGPSLIDANTQDCEDLSDKIKRQDTEITTLTQDVDNLKQQIRKNSQECTDEILRREKEIMEEIDNLRYAIERNGRRQNLSITQDTVAVQGMIILEDETPKMMMDGLKRIKRNIEIDMDNRINK